MVILNPTGHGVRSDAKGDGNYGASRGTRKHNGTDFICVPGQKILSPISGVLARLSYPYSGDLTYTGALLVGQRLEVKLWYFAPTPELIGKPVRQGDVIGVAQNITAKYGEPMTPHVHLQVAMVDPTLLMV